MFSRKEMKKGYVKCKDPRPHKVTLTLSDRELDAIDRYCKKYKAGSRSSVIREGAVRFVMGRFMDDYPTLFDKQELDRMIVPGNVDGEENNDNKILMV